MRRLKTFIIAALLVFSIRPSLSAEEIKQSNVVGSFYPASREKLSETIDGLLRAVAMSPIIASLKNRPVAGLISPHAGYEFSGRIAANGYALIQGREYKTVVIIGPSHRYRFSGVSVYPSGAFRTPLGDAAIDADFAAKLMEDSKTIRFERAAFANEHSVEVQIPFLQKVLKDFKIVPIVMGECVLDDCRDLARRIAIASKGRSDVLIIASTDLYHGYDYVEASAVDTFTLKPILAMDPEGLYAGLKEYRLQMCGGCPVVTAMMTVQAMGHQKAVLLERSNSASETGVMVKDTWTVGYASVALDSDAEKGGGSMMTREQKQRLLGIARESIGTYLTTGKMAKPAENDPLLGKEMGAFVTLHEHGALRGCIGSMTGSQPLYLTIRDMAVESATGDPRFPPVRQAEMKDIEIEISVLSPLEKVDSADAIQLGTHGVIVRKGSRSGVFLPQVATETGWTKEEFLSQLCSQKAGLPADAWKDKSTQMYVFTADVFSEKEFSR